MNMSINPITAYAISKWDAEQHITSLGNENFHVSVLRPRLFLILS